MMNKTAIAIILTLLSAPVCLRAAEAPAPDAIAKCVETTEAVFQHGSDRDPRILKKYYTPEFRSLLRKGSASARGEVAYLDADFLRMTQDEVPHVVKIGTASAKDGRRSLCPWFCATRAVSNASTPRSSSAPAGSG